MLYAAQRSEIIVVPGAMYFCMIGSRVAASLRSTGTMNPTFVATSYPPKTHCSQQTFVDFYRLSWSSYDDWIPNKVLQIKFI